MLQLYICVTWFNDMCTWWRRLIRYLMLQVIFRKRATIHIALLRKMTCQDKASYGSAPPCNMTPVHVRHDWFMCILTCYSFFSSCYLSHDVCLYVISQVYVCDMTHSYVRHDAFICATPLILCVPWRIHMCNMTHSYVYWRIMGCHRVIQTCRMRICDVCTCEVTHLYVWYDTCTCAIWLLHMIIGTLINIRMSHVARVMSHMCPMTHVWRSHGTYMNESWQTYECVIAYISMTHSYVCHASFVCVAWLIYMCAMTHLYVCHASFICVPCLIRMCGMTHSCVCHDSFICVPWLIHMCAMPHSYVCHDRFICVPWQIHMLDTSQTTKTHKDMQCGPWFLLYAIYFAY